MFEKLCLSRHKMAPPMSFCEGTYAVCKRSRTGAGEDFFLLKEGIGSIRFDQKDTIYK